MMTRLRRGLTLVESLVSIALISVLIVGIMGAFFISKVGTVHARHRLTAMNLVREYLEKEISLGYFFGVYNQSSAASVSIDGVTYTITPYPSTPVISQEGGVNYKLIGFNVTWGEPRYGGGSNITCSEKAVTHVSQH